MDKVIDIYLGDDIDTLELFPVSDLHLGSRQCDIERFRQFVGMILEKPNRYLIVNGDMLNNNITGAVGSPYDDIMNPREQKKQLKKELEPIAKRILCIVSGNHERRTKKVNDENPLEDIAEHLSVPYREEDAFIKLSFGRGYNNKRIAYAIYVTHGTGTGKRPGSSLNNIEALTLNCFADIYIMGHVHRKTAHKALYLLPDLQNNIVREVEMLYVISSSWQSYGGYAKIKGMRPSALGSVPILLSGREKEAKAVI